MKVLVGTKQITLDPRRVLGSGGEAVVITDGSSAYKVLNTVTPLKEKKLEALFKKRAELPKRILTIQDLIRDPKTGRIIGYKMPLAPKGADVIKKLMNRNFRAKSGMSAKDITDIFLGFHSTLRELHGLGFVVGDLNDLNELFESKETYLIDSDSFQFGKFPCEAVTENFAHPSLYPAIKAGGKLPLRFTEGTDWYSFAVLFFYSLLLVHPFGGRYQKVN